MTVFVTGGSGFVGLNLLEQLLERGDSVVSFSLSPPPAAATKAFSALPGTLRHVDGDVRDAEAVVKSLEESGADRVIHTAVITAGIDRERRDASGIVAVNVDGTVNVLEAARRQNVERFLYLSSASVYGRNAIADAELSESSTPPLPESLYAVTKYAAECIALRYRTLGDMPVVAARLSAVFGRWEYDTGLRDTLSPPYLLSRNAMDSTPSVLIDDSPRDWIYAPDVARGVLALLDAETLQYDVYNVGPGRTWTLVDWCEKLARRLPDFSYRLEKHRQDGDGTIGAGARRSPLSIRRIQEDTDFEARFGLDEAFDDYLDWLDR